MWRTLIVALLLTGVESKRFVLLDPDDSNLEKSAENITDADIRTRSLKMAKFRKWLKYDVDCDFITRDELEVKITQGRCPYEAKKEDISTTTTKQPKSLFFKRKRKPIMKTDKSLFSHQNKESVVRAVVGSNKMTAIDLGPLSPPEMELVSGSMITLKCDEKHREETRKKTDEIEFIEWFVNGKRIKPSWFDWRVSVSYDGKLGIWPIGEDDSGHFECLVDGQLKASVSIQVVPMSQVLLNGLLNYLFVCGIFAVATVSMGCLLGSRNQERQEFEVDRMEEFLAENVFKTDQMAKEKVANIIEKQGVIDERMVIEKKANGNRSTIMILLQNPDLRNLARTPVKVKNMLMKSGEGKGTTAPAATGTTTTTTMNETNRTNETNTTEVHREEESEESSEEEEVKGNVTTGTASKESKTSKSKESKTSKSKDSKGTNKKKKGKKGTKKKGTAKGKKKGSKPGKKKGAATKKKPKPAAKKTKKK